MKNIIFISSCFTLGALGAYFGQPYVHDNADALLIIITVISVFAGFLVAIITVLGDPSLIPDGSWRAVEIRREAVEFRIMRHISLFFLYLSTIGLLFVGSVLKKVPDQTLGETWKIWIDRSYMFFGISSFLLTFGLPSSLLRMQMQRLDKELQNRRREAGLDKKFKDPQA